MTIKNDIEEIFKEYNFKNLTGEKIKINVLELNLITTENVLSNENKKHIELVINVVTEIISTDPLLIKIYSKDKFIYNDEEIWGGLKIFYDSESTDKIFYLLKKHEKFEWLPEVCDYEIYA